MNAFQTFLNELLIAKAMWNGGSLVGTQEQRSKFDSFGSRKAF